jgi:hypothetical protein
VLCQLSYMGNLTENPEMERETGLEPAALSLEG